MPPCVPWTPSHNPTDECAPIRAQRVGGCGSPSRRPAAPAGTQDHAPRERLSEDQQPEADRHSGVDERDHRRPHRAGQRDQSEEQHERQGSADQAEHHHRRHHVDGDAVAGEARPRSTAGTRAATTATEPAITPIDGTSGQRRVGDHRRHRIADRDHQQLHDGEQVHPSSQRVDPDQARDPEDPHSEAAQPHRGERVGLATQPGDQHPDQRHGGEHETGEPARHPDLGVPEEQPRPGHLQQAERHDPPPQPECGSQRLLVRGQWKQDDGRQQGP